MDDRVKLLERIEKLIRKYEERKTLLENEKELLAVLKLSYSCIYNDGMSLRYGQGTGAFG
jgi:hypothetical protein